MLVTDADTDVEPSAIKLLVARLVRSRRTAAVAGAPHVTNRASILSAMQVLEAASIIGLMRRTQAVAGQVGAVTGVLGLFRRQAVIEVGGFDPRMATEDVDLSWRLLLAGWHTTYEPNALVGMEIPSTFRALWQQRRRWARGQGEVLHEHLSRIVRWNGRRLWPLAFEALLSLVWVAALVVASVVAIVELAIGDLSPLVGLGLPGASRSQSSRPSSSRSR